MRLSIFLVFLFSLGCGQKNFSSSAQLASKESASYEDLDAEQSFDEEEDIVAEIPAVISGAHLTCLPMKSQTKASASELSCAFSAKEAKSLEKLDPNSKLEIMVDDKVIVLEVKSLITSVGGEGGVLILELDTSDLQIMQEQVKEEAKANEGPQSLTLKDSSEVLVNQISSESGSFQMLSDELIEAREEPSFENSEGFIDETEEEIQNLDEGLELDEVNGVEEQELMGETPIEEELEIIEAPIEEELEISEAKAEDFEAVEEEALEETELLVEMPSARSVEREEDEAPIELVENGSFEIDTATYKLPSYLGSGYVGFFDEGLTGWQKSSGSTLELHHGAYGWSAAEGNGEKWLELCTPADSGIVQDIDTVPGQSYTLSFYFAARPYTYASSNHLIVAVEGVDVFDKKKSGKNSSTPSWGKHSISFVAEDSQTSLMFYSHECNSRFGGILLDQISVIKTDS